MIMMLPPPHSVTMLIPFLVVAAALICSSAAPSAAAFPPSWSLLLHRRQPTSSTTGSCSPHAAAAAALPTVSLAAAGRSTKRRTHQRQQFSAPRATVEEEDVGGSVVAAPSAGRFDWGAVGKYAAAIAVQMGLGYGIFAAMDKLVALSSLQQQVPPPVNFVLFYFLALKSRVLNPLANNRPQPKTLEKKPQDDGSGGGDEIRKRTMPSWTPPGFVFPIVWLLVIGPLRAVASARIYATTGRYACWPLLSLLLHLSIGDVWNTVNNVERRYGTAVAGVALVWLSKAHAAHQFARVDAAAGKLLAATLAWLTIAAALVATTWRLNPDPATGRPEPLYPFRGGQAETRFAWLAGSK